MLIHSYTWRRRDERGKQRSRIDYIAVDERLKKNVLDVQVVRGMFDGSNHYTLVAKIQVRAAGNIVRIVRVRETGYS